MVALRIEYRTPVGRELEKLLKIPIESFNDIITVLGLKSFRPLLGMFDFEGRKARSETAFLFDKTAHFDNVFRPCPASSWTT